MQKRSEGNNDQTEIGDIFQVVECDEVEGEGNTENDQFSDMEVNEIDNIHGKRGLDKEKGDPTNKEQDENDLDCVEIKEGSSKISNADRSASNSGKKQNCIFNYNILLDFHESKLYDMM